MSAMRRCGGCGYITKENGQGVIECSSCNKPVGKLRMLPEIMKDKKATVVSCCGQRWPRRKTQQ